MLRPTAISVKPQNDYCLLVQFDNDEQRIFDVKPYISGNWYGRLKDISIFNQVRVNGLSVEWPDGQDICPDCLYEQSKPRY